MIYIIIFLISISSIFIGENISNKSKFLFYFIAILIPSLLAGGRADFVGTDVRNYVEPIQLYANTCSNMTDYLNSNVQLVNNVTFSRIEKGYTLLIYLCSRFDKTLFLNFFITEFLILLLVLIGLYKFKQQNKNFSISMGMLIYYLVFYNMSLNMVRQSIAMSFLFLGFVYLIQKEWIKYLVFVVIAILFHRTAIIGMIPLFIYYFLTRSNSINNNDDVIQNNVVRKTQLHRSIILILILGFFVFNISFLTKILNLVGLSELTQGYLINLTYGISWFDLILRIPFIIIFIIFLINSRNNKYRYFYFVLVILDILLSMLGRMSTYSGRIALYTLMYYIYITPDAISNLDTENKTIKIVIETLLIMYLLVYWYYTIVYYNFNQTVPYVWNGF